MTTQTLTLQLIINRLQPLADPRLWVEQCLNVNTNHITVKVTDLGNIDPTVPNPVRVAAQAVIDRLDFNQSTIHDLAALAPTIVMQCDHLAAQHVSLGRCADRIAELEAALRAIRARLQGVWDSPDLVGFGEQHTDPDESVHFIVNTSLGGK